MNFVGQKRNGSRSSRIWHFEHNACVFQCRWLGQTSPKTNGLKVHSIWAYVYTNTLDGSLVFANQFIYTVKFLIGSQCQWVGSFVWREVSLQDSVDFVLTKLQKLSVCHTPSQCQEQQTFMLCNAGKWRFGRSLLPQLLNRSGKELIVQNGCQQKSHFVYDGFVS